jgi:hypothetical protein
MPRAFRSLAALAPGLTGVELRFLPGNIAAAGSHAVVVRILDAGEV